MTSLQASYELQMQQLRSKFEIEHDSLSNTQLKLQEERQLNESLQEELKLLKMEKDETAKGGVTLAISELEKEQSYEDVEVEGGDGVSESEKGKSEALEKENSNIKIAIASGNSRAQEMEPMLRKCEEDLVKACHERDKAMRELSRLKQHLLEKASAESEKIDEDGKIIDELRESNHAHKAQISQLEKALRQVIADKEEIKMVTSIEMEKSKKMVQDLLANVASSMNTIKLKDVEIVNLQTALGQYFAELETKENLELQLAVARDELTKRSNHIKDVEQNAEALGHEMEELSAKLSHREQMLTDTKFLADKLQKENGKLRSVLEQSITKLNRMSSDSDFLVDRRIVIKLLVTFFERNHSKEVLELMVRMLGFSEEEKQRIGIAEQGGRVARGVWGIPSRLVGGILGGSSSSNAPSSISSQNQSFADLWVDFLLKETEERERKELLVPVADLQSNVNCNS